MLSIQDLTITRGARKLFDSLSIDVEAGNIVVILGPNGAGKSTLLLVLAGLYLQTSGKVSVANENIQDCSHQQRSQYVAWQGELPPTEFGLTVKQRVNLAANDCEYVLIKQALAYMELDLLQSRSLAELSSGERQRVEIAAMMVRDCPLWLMDEPTAHLDMRHQADCLRLMKRQAKEGRTIVTVLHDLQQATAVADVVVLIDGKGGIEAGSVGEILTVGCLEPVFGVSLTGVGRSLMPIYGDKDEST